MADTYCDCDLVTGSDDGSSWANAWRTFQQAVDGATVDMCWCQGTDLISAQIDVDTNSGLITAPVNFIGVNEGTTNAPPQASDIGTDYLVIDGQDNAINGLDFDGRSYLRFENIKVHSCNGASGIQGSSVANNDITFCNVWCDDNDAKGIDALFFNSSSFVRCIVSNNGDGGVDRPSASNSFRFCSVYGNTGRGFDLASTASIEGCIIRDNTTEGIYAFTTNPVHIRNCVIDSNGTYGIETEFGDAVFVSGCRITNHSGAGDAGVRIAATKFAHIDLSYFGNNTTDIDGDFDSPIGLNTLGGSDTNHGYTTPGSDFNLRSDATLRREAVQLDATNTYYATAGLPPDDTAGGGGGGGTKLVGLGGGMVG